jgi:hypothetical protein
MTNSKAQMSNEVQSPKERFRHLDFVIWHFQNSVLSYLPGRSLGAVLKDDALA